MDKTAGLQILGRDGLVSIVMENGHIADFSPQANSASGRLLAMPALANAHDHARPLSTTSFAAAGRPLESWILRLGVIPPLDPYLAAAASLGRAARSGCASIMAHVTRLYGPMPPVEEAQAYAKAAGDIGIRATLALFMRDRNPLVYGPDAAVLDGLAEATQEEIAKVFCAPMMGAREQIARVDAIAAATENDMFAVQYGPNGVQWCSDELLVAIAEASERTGRRVHMHLLETPYQRAWADRHHPGGVVRHLRDIGFLSPRLTFAHCVHARPDELEMIAEAGVTIVTNASSNLHLRSGIAPIGEALRRGCKVAIGMDASALDEDDDVLRELRLAHFLHGGWGFDVNVRREDFLAAVVANGRHANGAPDTGAITVGDCADFLVLDLDALDRDALMPVDPLDLVFARANQSHVAQLWVAGRQISQGDRLLGIDLDAIQNELRAQVRSGLASRQGFMRAWPEFEPRLEKFYRGAFGCG